MIKIFFVYFFFNDTATTEIYTLSLHDALPICIIRRKDQGRLQNEAVQLAVKSALGAFGDSQFPEAVRASST